MGRFSVVETVKAWLIPGSLSFLLLGLGAGVLLLYIGKGGARYGRRCLTLLGVLYLVLALPVVSNVLIAGLEPDAPQIRTREDARGARALVVVGNGVVTYVTGKHGVNQLARRTAYAVLEGARIYDLIAPEVVIASGGISNPETQRAPEAAVIRDELVRLGVPADRIISESESRNTGEQMTNIARILREKSIAGPIVLVTTPAHGGRALMLAERDGLDVIPSMADELRYDRSEGGWRNWIPSISALRGSESAIYEYMALVYEWIRGWR